jgi:hypothetical protein
VKHQKSQSLCILQQKKKKKKPTLWISLLAYKSNKNLSLHMLSQSKFQGYVCSKGNWKTFIILLWNFIS